MKIQKISAYNYQTSFNRNKIHYSSPKLRGDKKIGKIAGMAGGIFAAALVGAFLLLASGLGLGSIKDTLADNKRNTDFFDNGEDSECLRDADKTSAV